MRLRLDYLVPAGVALLVVGVAAFGLAHLPPWWSPAHALGYCPAGQLGREGSVQCKSYNLFSGALSDVSELLILSGMATFAAGWWAKHNCHVPGCPWLSWHPHPEHEHPVCKRHHPHGSANHEIWDAHV